MKKYALIALVCVLCAGCAGGQGSAPPVTPTPTPMLTPTETPEVTPEATPEVTPEPEPFRLPAARGSNEVAGAVIGDFWVSADSDNRLISRRLGAPAGEEPTVLLDNANTLFFVAGDYAAVYGKPDADTPYRIVLCKPDGSEKITLPFRQDEFINVKWADERYAYEDADGLIRRVDLLAMERETLFRVDHAMWGMMGGYIVTVDFASDALVFYPLDTAKDARRLNTGLDILSVIVLGGGVLVEGEEDTIFIDGGLTARRLGSGVDFNRPWADDPGYAAGYRAAPDALGEFYEYFLVGAEGVYPAETMPLPGEDFDGTLPQIDPSRMIPMERYPVIDLEIASLAR